MKAIIRLVDGTEATYDTKDHKWHAEDKTFAEQLDIITYLLPHRYYRNYAEGIGKDVAAEIGAEVIYADQMDKEDGDPRALY